MGSNWGQMPMQNQNNQNWNQNPMTQNLPWGQPMGQPNYNNNAFTQPEKAPTEAHQKAKMTKEALQNFHSLLERYITDNYNTQLGSLKYYIKAYLEYHTKALEIYSKIFNDLEEIDVKNSVGTFIKMLGLPELLKGLEDKIALTSNSHHRNQFAEFEKRYKREQDMLRQNRENFEMQERFGMMQRGDQVREPTGAITNNLEQSRPVSGGGMSEKKRYMF